MVMRQPENMKPHLSNDEADSLDGGTRLVVVNPDPSDVVSVALDGAEVTMTDARGFLFGHRLLLCMLTADINVNDIQWKVGYTKPFYCWELALLARTEAQPSGDFCQCCKPACVETGFGSLVIHSCRQCKKEIKQ